MSSGIVVGCCAMHACEHVLVMEAVYCLCTYCFLQLNQIGVLCVCVCVCVCCVCVIPCR